MNKVCKFFIEQNALRITAIYIVVGILLFLFPDSPLVVIANDSQGTPLVAVRYWLFIGLTGCLIYGSIFQSQKKLKQQNIILSMLREEQFIAQEALSQQFNEIRTRDEKIKRQNLALASLHEALLGYKKELRERRQAEAAWSALEANYRAIFDAANDGVFVHDAATGMLIDINKKACDLYGLSYAEVMENGLSGLGTGESPYSEKEVKGWIRRAADDDSQLFEWVIKNKAKEHVWVEVNLKRAIIGPRNCILAVVRNIAERKAKEIEFHKMQANNQALMNAIPDILFRIKRDGTFIDYKAKNEELFLPPTSFLGKTVTAVLPQDIAKRLMLSIENAIISEQLQLFEYEMFIGNQMQSYEARIVPNGDDEVVTIIRNITERKELEERLTYLSLHDSMTGLYNRAYFEEEMQRIEKSRDIKAGIIICDVDGLKLINDNLGHSMGDEVIKAAADVLQRSFRQCDLVARIGGDEFAVIIHSNLNSLFEEACQQIETITREYNAWRPTAPLSLSTGFAVSKEVPIDMHALFIEADNQMYQDKLQRRNSTRNSIVQGMMDALEARDIIIEGHNDRLQALVSALASEVGLPDQTMAKLQLLARFYDIGKVGIPDTVLLKPGKLSAEEFAMVQRHCEIGHRIAASAPDLEPIADWILEHHEWWNGGGYPLGTKGADIPIESRILAIADAYDAMTSDRPYRKAIGQENAIAELHKCAGTQFDSKLVALFINCINTE